MKDLAIIVYLFLMLPLSAVAGDHPRTVGPRDVDGGHEWVAASRVLATDGSVKPIRMSDRLRDDLEWQLQRSAVDHGLEDGQVPSTGDYCSPISSVITPPPGESDGRFSTVLLLSEVAVSATLEDGIPGFDGMGNPVVLFSLSDTVPLHAHSPIPQYVLVPFDRLVISGRVFCRVNVIVHFWEQNEPPQIGDRVVVVGSWTADGVVRMGKWHHTGALALVGEEGALTWKFAVNNTGPRTLAGLQRRVDEAVLGNLFDFTAHLVSQEVGSPERREFAENWWKLHEDGCRVVEVVVREGVLVRVRKICSRVPVGR